jgi:hypothetical protein
LSIPDAVVAGSTPPIAKYFAALSSRAGGARCQVGGTVRSALLGPGLVGLWDILSGLTVGPVCHICWWDPSVRFVGGTRLSALLDSL